MAPPMPPRSIPAFLQAARTALTAPAYLRPRPLHIVVGNESADLDSICCAILTAYFRSHMAPHYTLHVPLTNLSRADLRLRPEMEAALTGGNDTTTAEGRKSTPTLDALITLSELPEDLSAADTRWLLVDHNVLTGDLGMRFRASVVGCIDHHVDEGVIPVSSDADETRDSGTAPVPRIVKRTGSCMSIVVDTHIKAWRALQVQAPDVEADRVLTRLAVAPILVDTENLTSAKTSESIDRQAVWAVEALMADSEAEAEAEASDDEGGDGGSIEGDGRVEGGRRRGSADEPAMVRWTGDGVRAFCERYYGQAIVEGRDARTPFFEHLMLLKNDITRFSYDDLFRKDYKEWQEQAGTLIGEPDAAASCKRMGYGTPVKPGTELRLGVATIVQSLGFLLTHVGNTGALLTTLHRFAVERRLDLMVVMTVQHDGAIGLGRQVLLWGLTPGGVRAALFFVSANHIVLGLEPWVGKGGDAGLDHRVFDDAFNSGEWRSVWNQRRTEYSRKQVAPALRQALRKA